MGKHFKDQVVVITGASAAVGRATARAFAQQGANVGLIARGKEGLEAARKRMRPRNRGTIVQVSSALAYRRIPLQSAYCGAKHALVGFIDALGSELIHDGSRVHLTAVQMPALNTPQFSWARNRMPNRPQPVAPIFQPEVAADAILFAARHRRRSIPVGGPTYLAEWGQKFVPGLLDRYFGHTLYRARQSDEADGAPRLAVRRARRHRGARGMVVACTPIDMT